MSDGRFRVNNANGAVQFDTQYPSLHCVARGNGTVTSSGTSLGAVPVNVAGLNNPFVAWGQAVANNVQICANWHLANAITQTWTIQFLESTISGAYGGSYNYYIFDTGQIPDYTGAVGTNAGIRIRDTHGNLLYTGLTKPLRVIDVISGTTAAVAGTHTYPSGPTYAAMITQQPHLVDASAGGYPHVLQTYVQVNASNVVVQTSSGNNALSTFDPSDFVQILILDVTGF